MARRFRTGRQRISLEKQSAILGLACPQFKCIRRGHRYAWRGTIRPTALCETYTVRIEYALGEGPKVFVEDPPLVPRPDGARIPHRYPDGGLCLYLPSSGEWGAHLTIAQTIVSWASEWLFYYEIWHATGDWLGGGVHPSATPETSSTL